MTSPSPGSPLPAEEMPYAQPGAPVFQGTSGAAVSAASVTADSAGAGVQDRFAEGAHLGQQIQKNAPAVAFEEGFTADPARVFAGPGYNFPPTPTNRPSQFALWISVIAVFFPFALVASVGAGVWGVIHAHLNYGVGRRQSVAALVISALSFLWWLFVWAAWAGILPDSL